MLKFTFLFSLAIIKQRETSAEADTGREGIRKLKLLRYFLGEIWVVPLGKKKEKR